MKKKMMKKFHLLLLLTAMFSLPVTLTSCGDDDDDDNVSITIPTGTATNLTMERVVGTWKRIHSSGKEIKNGRVTKQWDKNVERDQDHFVFYADGRCLLLDYEDDQRLWEVEERASFSIQNGCATFQGGTLRDVRIVSCTDYEMVIVYTIYDDGDPNDVEQYVDTLSLSSHRTDLLGIYDPSTERPGDYWNENAPSATGLTMRDIKGTWLITHSKGQIVEGGKITSTWNRDVTSKQNHFVFYNDGRAVFMEIKGDYKDQTPYWTVNGSAMFTLKDGQAIFSDGTLCAMKILSLKGNEMTVHYLRYQDKTFSVMERHTETLKLTTDNTDFLITK